MLKEYGEFKSKATAIVEELKEVVETAANNEIKLYVSYHYTFHDTSGEPFFENSSKAIQLCYERGNSSDLLVCVFVKDLNELERLNILDKMIRKIKEEDLFWGSFSMNEKAHIIELLHNLATALEDYRTKKYGASTAPLKN